MKFWSEKVKLLKSFVDHLYISHHQGSLSPIHQGPVVDDEHYEAEISLEGFTFLLQGGLKVFTDSSRWRLFTYFEFLTENLLKSALFQPRLASFELLNSEQLLFSLISSNES
jgi:hypothetical protein